MPSRDRTGPEGKGVKTGLGRGLCNDNQDIEATDATPKRGFGRGFWQGRRGRRSEQGEGSRRGRGFGRGQGRRFDRD